jgi:capsular polysaccharide biosynthesis protein
VQSEVRAAGFEIFELENMTADEQRNLFHSASHIVATHGAALANLIYCRAGTKLLEIRSELMTDYNCYYTLASHLSLNFYYFKARPVNPEKGHFGNLHVAIPDFIRTLFTFLNEPDS